ncbi:hypothetical protein, partial [Escherichia coli]|uniref:hypothetical protein n=1 Tax=Escherichia coli TaxID=562 RepID=UPI001BB04B7E
FFFFFFFVQLISLFVRRIAAVGAVCWCIGVCLFFGVAMVHGSGRWLLVVRGLWSWDQRGAVVLYRG